MCAFSAKTRWKMCKISTKMAVKCDFLGEMPLLAEVMYGWQTPAASAI